MDPLHLRKTMDQEIRKFGRAAFLHRPGLDDRKCWAHVFEFTAQARPGRVINPTDRRALVSALARDGDGEELSTPGVEDTLTIYKKDGETVDEVLRMYAPIDKYEAGGMTLMYDLQVRKA